MLTVCTVLYYIKMKKIQNLVTIVLGSAVNEPYDEELESEDEDDIENMASSRPTKFPKLV
jgi:hypothetical protein